MNNKRKLLPISVPAQTSENGGEKGQVMTDGWLAGWKEIAAYIGKSIKTAKRWRQRYSMPVRYDPGGNPVCIKPELDRWLVLFSEKKIKRDQDFPPVTPL